MEMRTPEQFDLVLTPVQKNAIGGAILLTIFVPFLLFPMKAGIYQFSPTAFWLFKIFLASVLPFIAMWVLAKKFAIHPRLYRLSFPPRIDRDLFGISLLVAVTIGAIYVPAHHLAWLFLSQFIDPPAITYHAALPDGIWRLPVIVALSFDAGFFESVTFIGLPWLLFRDHCKSPTGKLVFAVVTSVVFGACHRGNGLPEVIAIPFFGLAVAFWFFKIRDLWPVLIGHGLFDVWGFASYG